MGVRLNCAFVEHLLFMGLLMNASIYASTGYASTGPCFDDLNQPKLLRNTLSTTGVASGTISSAEGDLIWTETLAQSKKTVKELLNQLEQPENIKNIFKNPKTQTINATELPAKQAGNVLYKKIQLDIEMNPVLFVYINWVEDYLIKILKGTPQKPESFMLYYQKTSGTKYIKKYCGTLLVEALPNKATSLHFAEEINASHRTVEEMLESAKEIIQQL